MKKNIEEIIKKNGIAFNPEEPTEGHFERFAQQLDCGEQKKNRNQFLFWTLATAASLLILINILPFMQTKPAPQSDPVSVTVAYYNGKISLQIEAIEPLLNNVDDSTRNNLITILQTMKTECEKFPETPPATKEANYLAAIRTHYDSKLRSLHYIQSMLKNVRHPQQNG